MFKERINVENIQYVVESKGTVWAVSNDRSWAAPISLQDGRLYLHSLRQANAMPAAAYTLPYETIRDLGKLSPEVFIQLSNHGRVHGHFHITLTSKAENHEGILQRFRGEIVPTFHNTSVSSSVDRTRRYPSQFYGGIAPSTKVFTKASGSLEPCTLGNGLVTLAVVGGNPCFIVWYKPYQLQLPEQRNDIQLGWVTKGLHIVEGVAESPDVAQYTISDCGLVIE
ncbi:hypothetical protein SK128_015924 [Halocaridina rubra]|uniref:Uncharacterized protein n=1 Tax=Halocaridina rubra TaxID=373956 RepID=A0AAN8WZ97_HALRR